MEKKSYKLQNVYVHLYVLSKIISITEKEKEIGYLQKVQQGSLLETV